MMSTMHANMPRPEEERLCVLYNPNEGTIVHTHRVTTFPGGHKVDKAEMEKRIRERATAAGRDLTGLEILHVQPEEYKPRTQYRVDVRARKLVEVPKKRRTGKS
jgi:hypothetical protein